MPKRVPPPNYKQNLLDDLEDLRKDPTLSIARAAGQRAVLASTLRDRKNKGRQTPKLAHTHECLLSPAQEDVLVKWALFQDDTGIHLHQQLLIEKAEAIIYPTNLDRKIEKHWIERFMKHHKEIQMSLRRGWIDREQLQGIPRL